MNSLHWLIRAQEAFVFAKPTLVQNHKPVNTVRTRRHSIAEREREQNQSITETSSLVVNRAHSEKYLTGPTGVLSVTCKMYRSFL